MGAGSFHLGKFPDFGRGNPPVVAPAVGRQEVGTGARTLPEVGGSSLN